MTRKSIGIGYGPNGQGDTKRAGKGGPKTAKGKARSAKNALQHGVYGADDILPFEDPDEKQVHVQSFLDEYEPVGPTETGLVLEIADIFWRRRWIKLAHTSKVFRHFAHIAELMDNEKLPGDFNFRAIFFAPHEVLESELDEILHDHQSATKALQEKIRVEETEDAAATLDAMTKVSSPRLRNEWEKHLKRTNRNPKPEELPKALFEFISSKFFPRVIERLECLNDKKTMRALEAGFALSPDDTMGFERAESHLDRRLKTQLNILLGMQDRRSAREEKASNQPKN